MTKLDALKKLIYKVTGEKCNKNTIEEGISFLAEKIVGENPNTQTTADALNYIAENYEDEAASTKIPITESMTFSSFVMPEDMKVTLDKSILDYFSAEDKAAIEQQVENDGYADYPFYEYVDIPPHVDEEEEYPEIYVTIIGLSFNITDTSVYNINMSGNYNTTGDSNEFYIKFSSLDGINFFISSFGVLYYNDGAEYSVISQKMEFPIELNFSEMISSSEDAHGWNDVLSEFLFTEATITSGSGV